MILFLLIFLLKQEPVVSLADIKIAFSRISILNNTSYKVKSISSKEKVNTSQFIFEDKTALLKSDDYTIIIHDSVYVSFDLEKKQYSISFNDYSLLKSRLSNLNALDKYLNFLSVEQTNSKGIYKCSFKQPNSNLINYFWYNSKSKLIEKIQVDYYSTDSLLKGSFIAYDFVYDKLKPGKKIVLGDYIVFKNKRWIPSGKFSNFKIKK